MRLRLAILLTVVATAFGAAPAAPAVSPAATSPVAAYHACSSGWKHAIIGGQHKCLRAGQFCARRYDSQYRAYGYRCTRRDAAGRYRLTRI